MTPLPGRVHEFSVNMPSVTSRPAPRDRDSHVGDAGLALPEGRQGDALKPTGGIVVPLPWRTVPVRFGPVSEAARYPGASSHGTALLPANLTADMTA